LGDWIMDNFGWVIAGVMLLAITPFVLGAIGEVKQKEAFMAGCTEVYPQFECTAMWRSGNSRTQLMPIVVPVR
jgi:hypothetical protein